MMDEVALELFFSQFFCFPPLITILPLLHTHLPPPHEVCDSPDQAAQYHTLGTKLGASPLVKVVVFPVLMEASGMILAMNNILLA
jgi:hypothetical protein